MNNDIKRVLGVTRCGIVGALVGPLLGWVLSGLNDLGYYFRHETEKVIIWVVIGLLVGNVVQVVLEKLDVISKQGCGKDNEKGE